MILKASVNDWLRGIAGTLVLLSLALGWLVHPAFFLFTAFVGANLLQSAFSKSCPMMWLLRRLGVPEPGAAASRAGSDSTAVARDRPLET